MVVLTRPVSVVIGHQLETVRKDELLKRGDGWLVSPKIRLQDDQGNLVTIHDRLYLTHRNLAISYTLGGRWQPKSPHLIPLRAISRVIAPEWGKR
jgi:hypothetical protein